MGSLAEALVSHHFIGLDSSPFIYLLDDYPVFADVADELFEQLVSGGLLGCTSVVTLTETAVFPFRLGLESVAQRYRSFIADMPQLTLLDINPEVAMYGARLRARYRLRTPDALQLAACIQAGADAFVTNDRQLQRVTEIPVLLLSDFVQN